MSNELIRYDNKGIARLIEEAEDNLIAWTESIKALEESISDLKADLMKAMEADGCIKIETDRVLINYISETEKETFQTKKFKDEQREMYDEYCRLTRVAPQVRIKVK